MIVSGFFFSFVVGRMASIVAKLDSHRTAYNERMEVVTAFLKDTNLPRALEKRCAGPACVASSVYTMSDRVQGCDVSGITCGPFTPGCSAAGSLTPCGSALVPWDQLSLSGCLTCSKSRRPSRTTAGCDKVWCLLPAPCFLLPDPCASASASCLTACLSLSGCWTCSRSRPPSRTTARPC
jgi:hypothetical protein